MSSPKSATAAIHQAAAGTGVNTTCAQRETLTIAGFALGGNDWDGIFLGRRKGQDLIYAGKVDHGFDKKSSAELRKQPNAADPKNPPLHQANCA